MKMRFLYLALLGVLLLPAFGLSKDEWTNVNSKNFHLIGNANDKEIRRVATKLEQFREVFKQLFPKASFDSQVPTRVVVFKSQNAYKPFKPVRADGSIVSVAGYFQSGEDVNYITLTTEGESAATFRTIFHEYVHFMVDNNFGRSDVPPWFNEGLAEYYETFEIEKDQDVVLGRIQDHHLINLQQQKMIPFETFFNIDYFSLHNQGNHGRSVFYSQSWALMHYLQQHKDDTRKAGLSKFLGLLLTKKPAREAFREAFQTDYATMEKELQNYVKQRAFTALGLKFSQKMVFDAAMKSEPLAEPEAEAYLGDLLLHTRRFDDAATRLVNSIAQNDKSSQAHASLGMTRMRQRNFPAAKQHLEKAVALNAQNHLAHYYYAYVLSREPMGGESGFVSNYTPEATDKMRTSLAQAMKLNPGFAESYRLLAFVNLVNNTNLDEAVQAIKKAIALEPGNQWFAVTLAQIYARQQKFDEGKKLAERLAQTATEPQLRAEANNVLQMISRYEEHSKQVSEYNKRVAENNQTGGERQTITVETDADTPPEEAMNTAMNQALRQPQTGEQRIVGFLTAVECDAKGQTFVVRGDSQTFKLRIADMGQLTMTAFTQMTGDNITCGTRKPEDYVVATFRPTTVAKAKFNGDIIALEFMPKEFKLNR